MFSINAKDAKTNILSGLTVALALVPEAIAFALVAHVAPLVGLYAAFFMCLITAAFGGRPGMISGATGALAVVMVSLVSSHGVEYLFATVVLMGVLQMIFGMLKLGKFIRLVSYPVMLGFVNGLAVVIFLAQFSHFKVAGANGPEWMSGEPLAVMAALIAATMAVIYILPRFTKMVPSALAAIMLVSAVVLFFKIPTKTVGDLGSIAGGLPAFHVPQVPLNLETLRIIFPYALILAAIGLLESLLTLNLIDDITNTRGQPNRESLVQGIANFVTGFFGGMGGCAMIGQSMININNGARHRLAGICAAVFLLGFILFTARWIEMIPLAALIGVMFVVCEKTFEWGSLRLLRKIPRTDAFVIVAVTIVTVLTDLAIAVVAGVIIGALAFAWEQAKRIRVTARLDANGTKVYELSGTLFFASVAHFQNLFAPKEDPAHVVVEFKNARVVDHSGLEAIDQLAQRYAAEGKTLHLRHLSPDCRELLGRAKNMVEVNSAEDPHYHLADNRIG